MPTIERIQAMLTKEPDDVFLNFGMAMQLVNAGRLDEALAQFSKVLDLDPGYVTAYFQKGKTLLALGRRDDARAALLAGIEKATACGDPHAKAEMQQVLAAL